MHQSSIKKEICKVLGIYFVTWTGVFSLTTWRISRDNRTFYESASLFLEFLSNISFIIAIHILFALILLLFYLVRYFIRLYKKKGLKIVIRQFVSRFLTPLLLVFLVFKTLIYANSKEISSYTWDKQIINTSGKTKKHFKNDGKHRGMSVFGWRRSNDESIEELVQANVEWVAVVPFMYQETEKTKVINTPDNPNAFTRRDSMFLRTINKLHNKGIYVHLKPHLWMSEGWRSTISLDSDEEWHTWFQTYRTNMLRYARMAELTGVELFCIGTELSSSIKKQPEQWVLLISEIRSIYSGKLTYAANWYDEYEYVSFWDKLDYIGIQGYFPLTEVNNPDLETIKKGWKPHITTLEAFSKEHNKPILFTEVGYKSEASATIKPWEWGNALSVLYRKKSERTQRLAYEALFQQLWHLDWFAGIYIWEWDIRSKKGDTYQDLNFSPRFKEAENVIAKWFSQPVEKEKP